MTDYPFDFEQFISAGEHFLDALTKELWELRLPTDSIPCDHLCYRVTTIVEYTRLKETLTAHAQLLTEAMVNGRPICTFRLKKPFVTKHHTVWLVELPAPKRGAEYAPGFEHAEFVINECFTIIRARHADPPFTESGHPVINPELCLRLPSGKQAKFHHASLDRVIELEESKITDIIFDFDGTLIQSREIIFEVNRIVFSKALDRDVSIEESIKNYHPEFPKLFDAYKVTCPIKQKEALTNWGTVAEQFSYELFEGTFETLHHLTANGYRLHLWTARDEYSTRSILKKHSLESFFSTYSFASKDRSKPHADSLQFDWRSAPANQVLVIGDSPSDIIGARNIGAIRAAALWDPYACRHSLIQAGAELFFSELNDVKEWFKGNIRPVKV